jgi:hypothetical protein
MIEMHRASQEGAAAALPVTREVGSGLPLILDHLEPRFLASRPRFSRMIHSSSHVSDHLAFLMLAPHDHLDELSSESCGPSADAILSIKFRLLSINQSTRVNR